MGRGVALESAGLISEAGEGLSPRSHNFYVTCVTVEGRGWEKGPAGRRRGALHRSAPAPGGAGAPEAAPGSAPLVLRVARLVRPGRHRGADSAHGRWPAAARPHGTARTFSAGRPRAPPGPAVLSGDRAAVPCRPVTFRSEVPRRTARSARLIAPVSHAWFSSGPPLAGTDTRTNETTPAVVTRRRGGDGPELRCDRGTAPATSSRGPCPACPARPGSGRGSPSRGRGSPVGRRRRSGPPGRRRRPPSAPGPGR
ncbi:hypothetical protein SUDANB58_03538 [Streptomyces sp. enrichment culture]